MDWGQNWPYRSEDLQNKGHEGPLITCSKYHLVSSMPPTDYKYYTPISCKFLSWQTLIGSPPFFLVFSPAIWEVEVMGDRPGWPCLYRLARTETPARYTRYLCKYVWEVQVWGTGLGGPVWRELKHQHVTHVTCVNMFERWRWWGTGLDGSVWRELKHQHVTHVTCVNMFERWRWWGADLGDPVCELKHYQHVTCVKMFYREKNVFKNRNNKCKCSHLIAWIQVSGMFGQKSVSESVIADLSSFSRALSSNPLPFHSSVILPALFH